MTSPDSIEQIASSLDSTTLEEAKGAKLESRIDTKYIMHHTQLPKIIALLKNDYSVVNLDGKVWAGYTNIYFDTKDHLFYNEHHSGKLNRIKIRIRTYSQTKQQFLEIKSRSNNGRTNKLRIQTSTELIDQAGADFISKHTLLNVTELYPSLSVKYKRMTLLSKHREERVTIDTDLSFDNNGKESHLKELVIIEIKQSVSGTSELKDVLKQEHIHEESLSKYCIGISNLVADVKHNAFKELQNRIKTIIEHGSRIN